MAPPVAEELVDSFALAAAPQTLPSFLPLAYKTCNRAEAVDEDSGRVRTI